MRPPRLAVLLSLTWALLLPGVPPAEASGKPFCGIHWGSLGKSSPGMTSAPVVGARVGQHPCFDRLVVDLGGMPPPGFDVRYTNGFRAPGSGAPLVESGGATLNVSILAPGYRVSDLRPTVPWSSGANIVQPGDLTTAGFRSFRDLVYGGSFEGKSAIGLRVRARLPFRAFQLDGPDGRSRVVVDVAHRW